MGTRTPDLYRVKVALGWWETFKVPVMLPLRVSDSDFTMRRLERMPDYIPEPRWSELLPTNQARQGPGAQFDLNPSANGVVA